MRILLVDNSNTRTKFALASRDELLNWRTIIPTPEISPESLNKALEDIEWDVSIISSVVPNKAAILESFLGDKPCHQLSYKSKLPIRISYPKPEQIGADRLANAVGAHVLYGSPCIVLDFGTAVTFDVIAADDPVNDPENTGEAQASYQGGVIAPGLASMTEGLARRTALLPHIQLEEPKRAIGKTTEEAMLAGAVYGYRGLVREILRNLRKELPADLVVVATGGDAPLITRDLQEMTKLAPLLTLDGLRIIACLNF
ncbi:MAG: type III pantothenate kinase [Akkermansiaceae bacterium]|jgi:type III pantothenate kinase|tara:strand:+ start:7866 stop:8636 length:771 start_codon:yes stop_codon:yes gene_type:complete